MKQSIILVNISSGNPDLLNIQTIKAIKESRTLVLRTSQSAIVSWLDQEKINYLSLDDIYENADDFDQLSSSIAERLWSLAGHAPVVYAVSDIETDSSVRALFQSRPPHGTILTVPGVGMSDFFSSSVISLLPDSDLRTVSSVDFLSGAFDPNTSVLITELDNPILAGEIKIHLSGFLDDEYSIFFLHNNDSPVQIHLFELDRQSSYDHLSAVLIPRTDYLNRNRFVMNDLTSLMDRLRSQDGCPWDRAQTHQSLRPYVVEEAWECIAAIDENDMDHLCEELGDLLFQVVFHASIGRSYDEFSINDIISSICLKMIRRHPHVFGDHRCADQNEVKVQWETIKREETGSTSVISSLDDVASSLPSLKYAAKMMKKLSQLEGFKRTPRVVISEIGNVVSRVVCSADHPDSSDIGRLFLLLSELCCLCGYDGEILLRQSADRLKQHLIRAEKRLKQDGKSLEHLTFHELGVYLEHVEDEIE